MCCAPVPASAAPEGIPSDVIQLQRDLVSGQTQAFGAPHHHVFMFSCFRACFPVDVDLCGEQRTSQNGTQRDVGPDGIHTPSMGHPASIQRTSATTPPPTAASREGRCAGAMCSLTCVVRLPQPSAAQRTLTLGCMHGWQRHLACCTAATRGCARVERPRRILCSTWATRGRRLNETAAGHPTRRASAASPRCLTPSSLAS
jgi:hypothetical protein